MKHTFTRHFNKRVILSGKILEIYDYERPVIKGSQRKRFGRFNACKTTNETKQENRKKTAQRARAKVKRIINANPHLNKFLTLTFSDNITNLSMAWYEFEKFVKRLKTKYKHFKSVNVIEFQKRGAVHFHLLCNLPFIKLDELSKIWGHGFIKINRIDDVDNVGAYVTKYMTKDNIDERLAGRKCYSMSRNLKSPKCYTTEKEIDDILENVEDVTRVWSTEYKTEHYGIVKYTQVICARPIQAPRPRFIDRLRAWLIPLPDDTPTPWD